MNIHRILSGSPEHRKELIAAGLFVALWFGMDLVQFVDWAREKGKVPMCAALSIPLGNLKLDGDR